MKKVYNEEHRAFFLKFIPGHTDEQVADEFNRRFDVQVTPSKVHAFKCNNHIKSGTKKGNPKGESKLFPRAVRDYIRANNAGKTAEQMTELLNSHFSTSYTSAQIKGIRARMHLVSGLTGHFERGHIPANKGMKGVWHKGCENTWFKKGQIPHNHVAVGTEVMSTDGYLKIKVAEPNVWAFKHIMEWEKYHGDVPEGCLISFKDGDHYNCRIENLMCITRAENAILNHQGMRSSSPEVTESGLALAKLKHRICEIQKEQK
ncbi:MAG: HNH endonuclease [Treponema sp.]|nr:HNH endonuclease [Treponema sp.]